MALQSQTEDQTPSPAFISRSDESCLQTVSSGRLITATSRWEDGQTHPRGRDYARYLIPTQGHLIIWMSHSQSRAVGTLLLHLSDT